MYVVTKDGKKLKVDDSNIDYENEWVSFQQTVGLYTDDAILVPVWKVVGEKRVDNALEFAAERIYNIFRAKAHDFNCGMKLALYN